MIEYRQAESGDSNAIGLLHAQNFRDNNKVSFSSAYLETEMPAELLALWQERLGQDNDNQYILVAFDNDKLLGFICVYYAHDAQWGSLIDNLHVASAARKTGIGTALMNQAGSWLGSGQKQIPVYLFVLKSNTTARGFYVQLGARHAETVAMDTHGDIKVNNCRYIWSKPQAMRSAASI